MVSCGNGPEANAVENAVAEAEGSLILNQEGSEKDGLIEILPAFRKLGSNVVVVVGVVVVVVGVVPGIKPNVDGAAVCSVGLLMMADGCAVVVAVAEAMAVACNILRFYKINMSMLEQL